MSLATGEATKERIREDQPKEPTDMKKTQPEVPALGPNLSPVRRNNPDVLGMMQFQTENLMGVTSGPDRVNGNGAPEHPMEQNNNSSNTNRSELSGESKEIDGIKEKKRRFKHKKKEKECPFDKLNTLKTLYNCGHLTEEEYTERKNQIINEMTGTSSNTSGTKPQSLQPIMKTVVAHKPPNFINILAERAERFMFNADTLEWSTDELRVKIDPVPFATGQLRNAYFMEEQPSDSTSKPKVSVAKFCIEDADSSQYFSDVEMQAVCAHYAKLYNEHDPPLKVFYASSWILKLKDRSNVLCSVEEHIPGLYVKYSNNNGFVGTETSTTEDRERNTPHAFSHFTFVASDYKLMVVDIQGVHDNYTDPQIHSADGRGFGSGNLGTFGMEKFLQSHRCNEVCRWLGLRSLNKQYKPGGTAAPNYRMPHGAIKKSKNRITSERNAFSKSVTISEILGEEAHDALMKQYRDEQETSPGFLSKLCWCCFRS